MKMTKFKKFLSFSCVLVLIAAIALCTVGCKKTSETPNASSSEVISSVEATKVGEGAKQFSFTVVDVNGKSTEFIIKTDKSTVGEALQEVKLIDGEDSQYGLYVKTVNGITLDYDKDGKYWAFYENGKYAAAGVDKTEISEDTEYAFKAE